MSTKKEIELIPVSLIDADELQPRKNFNPERLGELMKSIKKHGVLNPLIVEEAKGGRYVLVDGKRRWRASKELRLSNVPAVIVKPQSDVDRLVQQFHLQEQHEGWSGLEKAMAVSRLAAELNMTVQQMAETLSLPRKTVHDYVSFSKLLERSTYQKSEIPINYASSIVHLREYTKEVYRDKLNKEFSQDRSRQLEKALIYRIKEGSISRKNDIVKLRDAIKLNPKVVDLIIENDKMTIDKAFVDSQGKVAWYFRNIISNSNAMASNVRQGLELGVENLFEDNQIAKSTLKVAHEQLGKLINKI